MYPNLAAEMTRKRIKNAELANVLGIAQSTMWSKLNSYNRMKIAEGEKIRKQCFPECTLDYLFRWEE